MYDTYSIFLDIKYLKLIQLVIEWRQPFLMFIATPVKYMIVEILVLPVMYL